MVCRVVVSARAGLGVCGTGCFPSGDLQVKLRASIFVKSDVASFNKFGVIAVYDFGSFVAGGGFLGSFDLCWWWCGVVTVGGVSGLLVGSFMSFGKPTVFVWIGVVCGALMALFATCAMPSCGSGLCVAC